jgi:hypothetical protein
MEVSAMNEVFGLDLKAWQLWLDYRKEIRKPLKSMSQQLAAKKLASYGKDQQKVVEQSIENGWTGLFPLVEKSNKGPAQFKAEKQAHRDLIEMNELTLRAEKVGYRKPIEGEDLIGYRTLVQRAEGRAADERRAQNRGVQPIGNLLRIVR